MGFQFLLKSVDFPFQILGRGHVSSADKQTSLGDFFTCNSQRNESIFIRCVVSDLSFALLSIQVTTKDQLNILVINVLSGEFRLFASSIQHSFDSVTVFGCLKREFSYCLVSVDITAKSEGVGVFGRDHPSVK